MQVCEDASQPGRFLFRYLDQTQFLIDLPEHAIEMQWAPPSTIEDACTYLFGPVLSFLLRRFGRICLHASAIRIENRAVAILGARGSGKSTTAAALARCGCDVISEDLLPVRAKGQSILADAGYPLIRLWPESVQMLLGHREALPKLTSNWDKRGMKLPDASPSASDRALELAAVYVLSGRQASNAPRVEALGKQHAMRALLFNAHSSYLMDRTDQAGAFEMAAAIARKVPVRSLIAHTDGQRLPELCDSILNDFKAVVAAATPAECQP